MNEIKQMIDDIFGKVYNRRLHAWRVFIPCDVLTDTGMIASVSELENSLNSMLQKARAKGIVPTKFEIRWINRPNFPNDEIGIQFYVEAR